MHGIFTHTKAVSVTASQRFRSVPRTSRSLFNKVSSAKAQASSATYSTNRKAVEGECSICHEDLKEDAEELTHCGACGGNFHYTCLEAWKNRVGSPKEATRPLCRHVWEEVAPATQHPANIEVDVFKLYEEWFYHCNISLRSSRDDGEPESIAHESGQSIGQLIDAYVLGAQLDDQSFCFALLRTITEVTVNSKLYSNESLVAKVYTMTAAACSLRTLLVEMYLNIHVNDNDDTLEQHWSLLPAEFMRSLSLSYARSGPRVRAFTVEDSSGYLPQCPADAR